MSESLDIIYLNDMDRTILDTDATVKVLNRSIVTLGMATADEIHAADRAIKASKGSFDVFGYLQDEHGVSDAGIDELQECFVADARQTDLLYPDARPYLQSTDDQSIIATMGGRKWQFAKLRGNYLDEKPYSILSEKYKGYWIASHRTVDGGYQITDDNGKQFNSRTACLVDDKGLSFRGLPEDCSGYWLVREDTEQLASQAGVVPPNVQIVHSLADIPVPIAITR